eukprot:TRINITY_DN24233_c0_g1_i1.p1 TRINITY_DN24233_c0_g1~~TRINITY_DN24233_c0_g1_i1.p1  ORF type:complete len:352 (-),score=46.38 TRINITY_DN24233_c0_g1_i1:68-1123(-)
MSARSYHGSRGSRGSRVSQHSRGRQASHAVPRSDSSQRSSVELPPIGPGSGRPPRLTADVLKKLNSQSVASKGSGTLTCSQSGRPEAQSLQAPRHGSLPPLPRPAEKERAREGASLRAASAHERAIDIRQDSNLRTESQKQLHGQRGSREGLRDPALVQRSRKVGLATSESGGPEEEKFPCPHCGRYFRSEAHKRHTRVCLKVFRRKRKAFDSAKQRILPDAIALGKGAAQRGASMKSSAPTRGAVKLNANWRQQSSAFRQAIREARAVSRHLKEGRPLRDLPPPQLTRPELDDRVDCPHCGRRFGQEQARRHIPACKNTQARPGRITRSREPPRPAPAAPRPPQQSTRPW